MARVNNSTTKKHQKAYKREVTQKISVMNNSTTKRAGQRRHNNPAVSLTSGVKLDQAKLQRLGRVQRKEAPGPYYTPTDHLCRGRHLHIARKSIHSRVAVFDLARQPPVKLAQMFVKAGILPDLGGQVRDMR